MNSTFVFGKFLCLSFYVIVNNRFHTLQQENPDERFRWIILPIHALNAVTQPRFNSFDLNDNWCFSTDVFETLIRSSTNVVNADGETLSFLRKPLRPTFKDTSVWIIIIVSPNHSIEFYFFTYQPLIPPPL
jgi:hypothetical protein